PLDPNWPYFNTSGAPTTFQHLAPGASVDYDLHGWSTAPGADWKLSTVVVSDIGNSLPTLDATATLSATSMSNGGSATLHVTAPADAGAGTAVIEVVSTRTLSDYNVWFLGVKTP